MKEVIVLPDIHLKPQIIQRAGCIMKKMRINSAVFLGDLVDDWGMENNISLYNETFSQVQQFIDEYPDTYFCIGNHEASYLWRELESGYSDFARGTVIGGINKIISLLPKGHFAYVHRIENIIFSHAGIMQSFVKRNLLLKRDDDVDVIVNRINRMGREELWQDDSPLWARPQLGNDMPYAWDGMLQVVGHTPVKKIFEKDGLLSVDTFSENAFGKALGNKRMIIVDCESRRCKEI